MTTDVSKDTDTGTPAPIRETDGRDPSTEGDLSKPP